MLAFHSFESFVRMGGYGLYVWPAMILAVFLLCANLLMIHSELWRLLKRKKNRDASSENLAEMEEVDEISDVS